MSKKIFFAAPFYQCMSIKGNKMTKTSISLIQSIIDLLENKGYYVENAHRREKWGEDWMSPEVCTPLDYRAIKESDIFIAIPGNPPSGGVHIEIGWASLLCKNILLLLEREGVYSNLVEGLYRVNANTKIIRYGNPKDLLNLLDTQL